MTMRVDLGDIFHLKLELPPHGIVEGSYRDPGNILMDDIDTSALQVISARWVHGADRNVLPYLGLKIRALKEGTYDINYLVELDAKNPLFVERKERIIVNNKEESESDIDVIEGSLVKEEAKSWSWWNLF